MALLMEIDDFLTHSIAGDLGSPNDLDITYAITGNLRKDRRSSHGPHVQATASGQQQTARGRLVDRLEATKLTPTGAVFCN